MYVRLWLKVITIFVFVVGKKSFLCARVIDNITISLVEHIFGVDMSSCILVCEVVKPICMLDHLYLYLDCCFQMDGLWG